MTAPYRLLRLNILIIMLLGVAGASLQAQIPTFKAGKPTIYFESAQDVNPARDTMIRHFGNYPVSESSRKSASATLEQISDRQGGMVYMVIRKSQPLADDHLLMQFGCISIYPKESNVCGGVAAHRHIEEHAVLVRLQFQRSPRRYVPQSVFIDTTVTVAELLYFNDEHKEKAFQNIESYLTMKYSLLITPDAEGGLENILDNKAKKAWSHPSDQPYQEEIMTLGRVSDWHFYQPQTFPANNQLRALSLNKNPSPGNKGIYDIRDNGLMLWSKKDIPNKGPSFMNCGFQGGIKPWKIHLINWASSEDSVSLHLDTAYGSKLQPYVWYQGKTFKVSRYKAPGWPESLRVPVPNNGSTGTMYLYWNKPGEKDCDADVQINLDTCFSNGRKFGHRMNLQLGRIDPQTQKFVTLNYNSGSKKTSTSKNFRGNRWSTLLPKKASQVHLIIWDENRNHLLDSIIYLPRCSGNGMAQGRSNFNSPGDTNHPNHPGGSFKAKNGNGSNGQGENGNNGGGITNSGSTPPALQTYPVPASRDQLVTLQMQNFRAGHWTIEVMDGQGRLLQKHDKAINTALAKQELRFDTDGLFLIRVRSGAQVQETRIIIR